MWKFILVLMIICSCEREYSFEAPDYVCGQVYDKGFHGFDSTYHLHVFVGATHYDLTVDSLKYDRVRIPSLYCFKP